MKSALKRTLVIAAIVVAAILAGGAWYFGDYSHADPEALAVVADENGESDGVVVETLPDGKIAFVPAHPTAGLVFYPGAKVEAESYAPLLERCAKRGILCVLSKPPLNFAFLDVDAASAARAQFPDVDAWIVAGHSLGGVAACEYASRNPGDVGGIVLLASYPAADLSGFEGPAVSILGTEDRVLDRGKYDDARPKLPAATREVEIEGGNHAQFGNYGKQAGDGEASIVRDSQQEQTVEAIAAVAALAA